MKILFFPHSTPDAPTDSTSWGRGFVHAARLGGLTVEVVEPSALLDLEKFQPDAVVVSSTSSKSLEILTQAHARGIAAVVALGDLNARDPIAFDLADAVIVASSFASRYYAEALGLVCTVMPTWVDPEVVIASSREPRYVTFVDPWAANGAYVFARIADELGRVRPDIPLLIVGTRGSGATLASCGIDIFARGNVHLKERTEFPRDHWQETRVALLPSLGWDASPRKLAEAAIQGIPAITSDRGALGEFPAKDRVTLAIPDRITPASRSLPTAEEVAPWVEAIIRLWDAPGSSNAGSQEPMAGGRIHEWFRSIIDHHPIDYSVIQHPDRSRSFVLVPYYSMIDRACEDSLRKLEEAGVRVVRSEGCPQIDVARNALASDALNQGAESIFFIDADIGFDPLDVLRLLARPEPVISGVYARKGQRAFASIFATGTTEIVFGANAQGPYPLKYAAGGFLRIKSEVLTRMITELNLPVCNTDWGRRDWPFFLPLVASSADSTNHYLGEDWAFSYRLRQIGITPMADTSIRLWHMGSYPYGWEDAGAESPRHSSYRIEIKDSRSTG